MKICSVCVTVCFCSRAAAGAAGSRPRTHFHEALDLFVIVRFVILQAACDSAILPPDQCRQALELQPLVAPEPVLWCSPCRLVARVHSHQRHRLLTVVHLLVDYRLRLHTIWQKIITACKWLVSIRNLVYLDTSFGLLLPLCHRERAPTAILVLSLPLPTDLTTLIRCITPLVKTVAGDVITYPQNCLEVIRSRIHNCCWHFADSENPTRLE